MAPGRVLETLAISGLQDGFYLGDSHQLRAEAVYSTGDREDVTSAGRWSSKTLSCVVTASGLVTAIEIGDCAVDVAYAGATAGVTVGVKPSKTYTISGVVREKWGFREPPIPGATVTLMSGTQTGRTVTTDGAGRYVFAAVPIGPVSARAEAAGYEPSTADLSPERATTDFFLVPPFNTISWSFPTKTGPTPTSPVRLPFETRHRGPVSVTVFSTLYECDTSYNFVAVVYYEGTNQEVLDARACKGFPYTVESILDPGRYVLQIFWHPHPIFDPELVRSIDLTYPR